MGYKIKNKVYNEIIEDRKTKISDQHLLGEFS